MNINNTTTKEKILPRRHITRQLNRSGLLLLTNFVNTTERGMDNIVVAGIIITDNCANLGLKPIKVNMSAQKTAVLDFQLSIENFESRDL